MRTEENVINVIFDPGKGQVNLRSREAVAGEPMGELPTPTRRGYAFAGWYCDGKELTAESPVPAGEDIRLLARWTKKAGESRKITMYKRQKRASIALSVVAVVLVLALLLANQIVSIYGLNDVYYDESGERHTEKYYIRKDNGVYALFARNGERMKTDEDGNFLTRAGNVYAVDPETGDYELFAVVDYDGASGEVLNAQKTRVMMYKRISQDNIQSIKVTNQKGSYEFYRDEKGKVQIRGVEDAVVSYDAEAFAMLCVDTGYSLSMQKLDFTSPHAPLLPDGSVNYDAYGLEERRDAEGNITYTPSTFTITGTPDNESQPVTHTVLVGDALVSGGGYYVRRVGHDAVYIMDAGLGDSVLQPVESMVTPMIVYPTSAALYLEAYEFVMAKANLAAAGGDAGDLKDKMEILVSFTAQDLESRLNTLYTSSPFYALSEPWASTPEYAINDSHVSSMMASLFEMEFLGCRKLGITNEKGAIYPEVLEEFNLLGEVRYITYASPMIDASGNLITDEDGEQLYANNRMIISPRTEQGTYYIASLLCDMVVEVDQTHLAFMDWEISDWYNQYFYSYAMAYVQNLGFTVGDKTYTFSIDNTMSYAYYENASGEMVQTNVSKGSFYTVGGEWKFVTSEGTFPVKFIKFDDPDSFVYQSGSVYYVDEDKKMYRITTGAYNMDVYMEEYTGSDGSHKLDYSIPNVFINDKGEQEVETVTAVTNFRRFVEKLAYFSIEGDVDEKEFKASMGMTVKEFIAASGNINCDFSLSYKVKDMASVMNQHYFTNEQGEKEKTWSEDNEREAVIRFYRYSEKKALMTIETVTYDSQGNRIVDPTRGVGLFYVDAYYLEELAETAEKVLTQQLIPSTR